MVALSVAGGAVDCLCIANFAAANLDADADASALKHDVCSLKSWQHVSHALLTL